MPEGDSFRRLLIGFQVDSNKYNFQSLLVWRLIRSFLFSIPNRLRTERAGGY